MALHYVRPFTSMHVASKRISTGVDILFEIIFTTTCCQEAELANSFEVVVPEQFFIAISNARIFRETKSQDRKFPDRTFQDRKILGPENSRNSIFSRNSRNIFLRKFQDFFLLEQKIPGLLTLLNSWTTNSVTEFSRTFFYIPEPLRGLSSMNLLNIPKSPGYSGPMKPIAPGYPGPMKRKSPSGYSSKNLLDS